jgi:hypothetical protein
MKIIILAVGLILAGVACSPAETNHRPTTTTSAGLVDGRRYEVAGTLPDGTSYASQVSFSHGQFDSSACHRFGFTAGRYTVSPEGDVIAFRAEMPGKNGPAVWTGTIAGDAIDGTVKGPEGVVAYHGKAVR